MAHDALCLRISHLLLGPNTIVHPAHAHVHTSLLYYFDQLFSAVTRDTKVSTVQLFRGLSDL